MKLPTSVALALAMATSIGCYDGSGWDGQSTPQSDAGAGMPGLPCEVATILVTNCLRCHNGGALSASPLALTSRDALMAPAPDHASQTVAERALSRIADGSHPMPPPPSEPLAAADVQALDAWVAAGYPEGTCGDLPDAGPDPYDTPTVCTSGRYWRGGNEESPNMRPGGACIACHRRSGEGPRYVVAGTVYPTAHEFDDCNGVPSGAVVVITDANGDEVTITPNSVGNFEKGRRTTIVMPYRARVVLDGRERVMSTAQTDGDCNGCHTERGNERAPGRIMLP